VLDARDRLSRVGLRRGVVIAQHARDRLRDIRSIVHYQDPRHATSFRSVVERPVRVQHSAAPQPGALKTAPQDNACDLPGLPASDAGPTPVRPLG
jgi:hypothetical protein